MRRREGRRALRWKCRYGGQSKTFDAISAGALWHRDGPQPVPLRWVLLCDRSGKLKPLVLGCTDQSASPGQIVLYYVGRWAVEVTVQEARRHLGIETQRQWSKRAVERTTPCLFGLFSLVVLLAHRVHGATIPVRRSAWYAKEEATFVDVLAVVRRELRRTGVANRPAWVHDLDLANSPSPQAQRLHPSWRLPATLPEMAKVESNRGESHYFWELTIE